jgi:DNA-binding transcriptional LysR family regulator
MHKPPNLRHLHVIDEVARLGSINRASQAVHLSQSATTQAVLKLEQDIGEPLFHRSSTGMLPTEAGHLFLARVRRALDHLKGFDKRNSVSDGQLSPVYRSITTTQLKALIAVVETGGFSLAADRLGVAQPTVHRAAKDLERISGSQLFIRAAKGVDLTYRARQLAQLASLTFTEIQQGFEEIDELNGRAQGQLRIGCLPLARTHLLPTSVTQLLDQYPEVKVSIVDGPYREQLNALLHGQLDCILGALRFPAPTPEIHQEALFEAPLSIIVRAQHPALSRATPSMDELALLDWIAPAQGTPGRQNFNAFFHSQGLQPPEHVIECGSLVAIRGLLLASNRAAIISARQVHYEILSEQLAVLSDNLPGTSRPIGLTYREDWKPTAVQSAYLSIIRDLSRTTEKH